MLNGWRTKTPIPNMTPVSGVIYPNAAAVDPSTNKVYVPNGITLRDATGGGVRYMLEYDVVSGASKHISQSDAGSLGITEDYAVVWSTSLNKLLVFGGRFNQTLFNINLYAFTPSSGQWRVLPTNGDGPGGRSYACMVPAYSGSKFVVFGGEGNGLGQAYSDVYVLDVSNPANLLWTRLAANLGPELGRGLSACAVDHDLFIAWAGGVGSLPVTTNTTMVFNLKTSQWVNEFTPSVGAPSPIPTPEKTSDPNNLAGIIGGAIGGVALVTLVAWIVYQRSKSRAANGKRSESPRVEAQGGFQNHHEEQGQENYTRRSRVPHDYEPGIMSTDGVHGYKHQLRSPQSLGLGGAVESVAWESINIKPHDPQNLEHAQRFRAA
ncbi:hypothetical protein BGZ93_009791 [Podila epicladia]|nr:hypothetical protein BGZ93_009791 [Podila epicladia]